MPKLSDLEWIKGHREDDYLLVSKRGRVRYARALREFTDPELLSRFPLGHPLWCISVPRRCLQNTALTSSAQGKHVMFWVNSNTTVFKDAEAIVTGVYVRIRLDTDTDRVFWATIVGLQDHSFIKCPDILFRHGVYDADCWFMNPNDAMFVKVKFGGVNRN